MASVICKCIPPGLQELIIPYLAENKCVSCEKRMQMQDAEDDSFCQLAFSVACCLEKGRISHNFHVVTHNTDACRNKLTEELLKPYREMIVSITDGKANTWEVFCSWLLLTRTCRTCNAEHKESKLCTKCRRAITCVAGDCTKKHVCNEWQLDLEKCNCLDMQDEIARQGKCFADKCSQKVNVKEHGVFSFYVLCPCEKKKKKTPHLYHPIFCSEACLRRSVSPV